jgi:hypothetical protein
MSRRDDNREMIRDALAEVLVQKIKERMRGTYDLGVVVTAKRPGIHVRVRIDDTVVERALPTRRVMRDVELLADELVDLRNRRTR